ncbi:amino acid ABC transporter substrate-binding protein [Paenibacillus doosanensis]|uniref:Amino-acid-binding protein YxeM n=1 Tax=Paenibacillus konkukensis TaxID=2020716 RepID=A0ABY4RIK2_9BACL|nr:MULTISPECIES: amino acid ABC transporter substrate-binding protein [Paenibacillus]MCS7464586.1 amino acid ABC transporter substrate-binding protein [Paenibacillus doosanensis]UQZ82227.1 putative amino-acid-binding protein YxeM precursor [Paenibacillus konkukensis]
MKHTGKAWIALLMMTVLLVLSACGTKGQEAAPAAGGGSATAAQEQKVLRVGATGQSYPYAYKEDDKLQGFDVEVVEAVAKKLGYKVEWQLTEFSGVMAQLELGKLDTVSNQVAITPERKEKYDFTQTYAYAGSQVVVKDTNNEIHSVADLKGKTVAVVLGSNHAKNLEKQDPDKQIKIKTYESQEGTMNDVAYGRVDAYVNSRNVLLAQIKKNKLPLKLAGEPFVYEEVGFPFAKDEKHAKIREEFNKALDELRQDGTLKTLSEKYFDEDVTVKKAN